jgi:hypothetical protein
MHGVKERLVFLLIAVFVVAFAAYPEVGGKITGVVKDQSASVIAGATVVITNTQTGTQLTAITDQGGVFTFPVLPVGQYQIDVTSDAFQPYRKTGLVIDINSALVLDVTLQVKQQDQSIVVTEDAAQVETTDTQLGQVLGSKKVTEIPLNGRSYTDLFATQVGVTPLTTSGAGNSTSGGGFGTVPVAGTTNTGQFSINGQREDANGFSINGANVQEGIGQQAGIIPNLDSIAEFRILTSNTDAERYTPISGAGSVYPYNKTPYTMSSNLTIERQLGSNTLLSTGYIGSLSRHLLAVHSVSPGNPALCLSLSQSQDVMPRTPTCGPFGENTVYTRASGTVVNGTRSPYPNTIGTDAVYQNMGNANYNSLQTSLKRTAGRFTFLASYTTLTCRISRRPRRVGR